MTSAREALAGDPLFAELSGAELELIAARAAAARGLTIWTWPPRPWPRWRPPAGPGNWPS